MMETFRGVANFSRQSGRPISHQAAPRQTRQRSEQQDKQETASESNLLFAGGNVGGAGNGE